MTPSIATFGEIMLRLTPPGFERLLQSPHLNATFGGGEANVAVSLAQFGAQSRYLTVLPPKNAVADALLPARVLHDDFVYRHRLWAGPGGARPGSRQQINC